MAGRGSSKPGEPPCFSRLSLDSRSANVRKGMRTMSPSLLDEGQHNFFFSAYCLIPHGRSISSARFHPTLDWHFPPGELLTWQRRPQDAQSNLACAGAPLPGLRVRLAAALPCQRGGGRGAPVGLHHPVHSSGAIDTGADTPSTPLLGPNAEDPAWWFSPPPSRSGAFASERVSKTISSDITGNARTTRSSACCR